MFMLLLWFIDSCKQSTSIQNKCLGKQLKKGRQASCIASQVMEKKLFDQIAKKCRGGQEFDHNNASSNMFKRWFPLLQERPFSP